ncbi:anthranilate synthase component I [Trichosporon asahii var. asahii CBS 8904]|uniref:Anthranilate synthase component I n=1 Tax=Trichosporon asahii var. asahii (strain CBS 8904) TaxID=1220162 RepID=K1VIA2_TRIAC|nr:anthranilate synthase component I [Trichosporon asahii var. asahii CBS 8904]
MAGIPSLEEVTNLVRNGSSAPTTLAPKGAGGFPSNFGIASSSAEVPVQKPNLVPVYIDIPGELLTPVAAYLKVANGSKESFLLESITGGENLARYSFVGANPIKSVRTGPGFDAEGDPLNILESVLEPYRYGRIEEVPTFTGGAVGFITYDAIQHFEPVTKPATPHRDPLPGLPEAFFMIAETIVIFDHIFQSIKIVSHVYLGPSAHWGVCRCGRGVPSSTPHRIVSARYKRDAVQGREPQGVQPRDCWNQDAKLGAELLASEKDRAEHIMLVDLARNDVNRVCAPETVQVDDLMRLEKFSHVIHITSQISGQLRPDQSRFDAFRSIFPAGTVSGAPKVKAIQLVGGLEQEKRGVYAGAVGRFDFDRDNLDTCIAIRTMTFMGGNVYLQAGGGIVFDSVEEDEVSLIDR